LDPRRWSLKAAAALGSRVRVEIRISGRIWRQELRGVTSMPGRDLDVAEVDACVRHGGDEGVAQ
jgi:hypothetical protein